MAAGQAAAVFSQPPLVTMRFFIAWIALSLRLLPISLRIAAKNSSP
jgi:hypothetical protein